MNTKIHLKFTSKNLVADRGAGDSAAQWLASAMAAAAGIAGVAGGSLNTI